MRRSKEEAEQTRLRILRAAEELFSQKGVQSSSLEQIARAAGVTRGAIYWHFKDKQALLQALSEKFAPPEDELTKAALEGTSEDIFVVFERSAERFLALFAADESRQNIFTILSSDVAQDPETRLQGQMLTRRLAERAAASGILAEDVSPEEAGLILVVTMRGLLSEWLTSGRSFDLPAAGMKILRRQIRQLRR